MKKQGAHKQKKHSDLIYSEAALKRAAIKAREIARKTGTAVVYSKNGKIIKEYPVAEANQSKDMYGS